MPTNEQYAKWIQKGDKAKYFHGDTIVYSEMSVRASICRALRPAELAATLRSELTAEQLSALVRELMKEMEIEY